MVKKKTRNVPAQDTSSAGPSCAHLRKALDEGTVKRALVNVDWTVCQDCVSDIKEKDGASEESVEMPSVWLCLQCGYRGCGRYSEHQHALNHYNTPRSAAHSLVLGTETWSVWCYACDDEVPFTGTSRLGQLVEYIRRKSKPKTPSTTAVLTEQEAGASEEEKETQKSRVDESKEDHPHQTVKGGKTANTSSSNQEPTVKGLSNLGNTCFFNAVMQNLSQTPILKELLNEVKQIPQSLTIALPDSSPQEVLVDQPSGPLTLAMCLFLMEMQETKKGVVTPKEVFSQVCKKAIRFKGYQQQDSQELLRYLLDGMRGEEIQRISTAMAKALHGTSGNRDEEDIKKKVKDYERRRVFPNFVDRLFGGELTSTVMCEECNTVSLVHEPFLDLSLPVLDDVITKKISIKTSKNVAGKKAEVEEEEEEGDDDGYVKEKSEGTGTSKHFQKKAKKQAKKQAKNQRRQQKFQDKTVLLNNLCASEHGDGSDNEEPPSTDPPKPEADLNLGGSARPDGEDAADQEGNTTPNILDGDSNVVLEKPSEDEKAADGNLGSNMEVCKENSEDQADADTGKLEQTKEIGVDGLENRKGMSEENVTEAARGNQKNGTEMAVGNLEHGPEEAVENRENGTAVDVGNLEHCREMTVGNLEHCREMTVGNPANGLEEALGTLQQSMEVSAGNLERDATGCQTSANTDQPACNKHPATHLEQVRDDDQLTEDLNRLNLGPVIEPSEIELEIIDEPLTARVYEVVNEDPKTAFSSLSDREGLQLDEHSVLSCLYQFSHKESLTGNNQLLCNVCTRKHACRPKNNVKGDKKCVFTNAKKQMLISAPPPILTLHLKRFQQNGFSLHKINKHIKFQELVDLAPFCTSKCKNIREGESRLFYSLYGVIEHSGTMRSGHYTAYVKLRTVNPQFCDFVLQGRLPEELKTEPTKGHWYHISDSHVQPVPLSKVLSAQAYLLFYERVL